MFINFLKIRNFKNLSYEVIILKSTKKDINLLKIHTYSIKKNTNNITNNNNNHSLNIIIYDVIK